MMKGQSRLRWVLQLMILGQRKWDLELLRTCMYDHDIDQVRKLRLSNTPKDTVVRHYDRHGLFTVRSAYRLALQTEREEQRAIGSSSHPDGSRQLYKRIWVAQVPPEVWVFTWRVSGGVGYLE
jgi:hypothetical protein